MKVLERHEPPNQWPREFPCANCQSRLQVDAVDVKFSTGPYANRDGRGWFSCPVCLKMNDVAVNVVNEAMEWQRLHRGESR